MTDARAVTIKTGPNSTAQGELIMGETVTLYGGRPDGEWAFFEEEPLASDTHTLTVPASWIVPIEENEQ